MNRIQKFSKKEVTRNGNVCLAAFANGPHVVFALPPTDSPGPRGEARPGAGARLSRPLNTWGLIFFNNPECRSSIQGGGRPNGTRAPRFNPEFLWWRVATPASRSEEAALPSKSSPTFQPNARPCARNTVPSFITHHHRRMCLCASSVHQEIRNGRPEVACHDLWFTIKFCWTIWTRPAGVQFSKPTLRRTAGPPQT